MAVTVISEDRATSAATAVAEGEELWLSPSDLTAATGWDLKPQGMCLGDRCVPLSEPMKQTLLDRAGRMNFAAFARYLDRPYVHDDAAKVWLFGESGWKRTRALASLEAPDFRLPDLDGRAHALSDYRGKKVLLLTWASW